jgi:hypothetical protein
MVNEKLKEVADWLRTTGWEQIKQYVQTFYELDKVFIEEHGGLTACLHIPYLETKTGKITWGIAVLDIPGDELRENFTKILHKIWTETGSPQLLPLGYVFVSEGTMWQKSLKEDEDSVKKEEVYLALVNTFFGKKAMARAPVDLTEGGKKVVGELEWNENILFGGTFALPLPDLFESALKEGENPMWG